MEDAITIGRSKDQMPLPEGILCVETEHFIQLYKGKSTIRNCTTEFDMLKTDADLIWFETGKQLSFLQWIYRPQPDGLHDSRKPEPVPYFCCNISNDFNFNPLFGRLWRSI